MNITLWIVQGLLAAFFGAGGVVKMVRPPKRLVDQGLTWVEDFSPGAVKAIGAVELLAAIGLVLPAVTGIAPVLVPLAGVGLGLLMVGAAVVHVPARRGALHRRQRCPAGRCGIRRMGPVRALRALTGRRRTGGGTMRVMVKFHRAESTVRFVPVTNADDLQRGLAEAAGR